MDTLLTALREMLRNLSDAGFPAEELGRVMAQRSKSLEFVEEEMEDLADMRLADPRIFPLLTMLFPYIGSRGGTDIDHVFPKSRFTAARLNEAGVPPEQIEEAQDWSDRLTNLQLLDPTVNNEKRAVLPAEWLDTHCPEEQARQAYCERHMLGEVPRGIKDFGIFCQARRELLRNRILGTGELYLAALPIQAPHGSHDWAENYWKNRELDSGMCLAVVFDS